MDPQRIYVGYSGSGLVEAFEIVTGTKAWSQPIPGSHSIQFLQVSEGLLSVYSSNIRFDLVRAEDGEVLQNRGLNDKLPRFRFADLTFVASPWQALDTQTGKPLWTLELGEELTHTPVLSANRAYLRTERTIGRLLALDRSSGELIWQTGANVISNVAASETRAYVLRQIGDLVGLDSQTGTPVMHIQFETRPFRLSYEGTLGGYHVAYDEDADVVIGALGDSYQLFAFKPLR
jgi:outer membrane protein assembly factor BamB